MGNCLTINGINIHCKLCNENINTKQQFQCNKCSSNYHIKCFTNYVTDLHTCPNCGNEVTKIIKNPSITNNI